MPALSAAETGRRCRTSRVHGRGADRLPGDAGEVARDFLPAGERRQSAESRKYPDTRRTAHHRRASTGVDCRDDPHEHPRPHPALGHLTSASTPICSNATGVVISADTGPVTTTANTVSTLTITLPLPLFDVDCPRRLCATATQDPAQPRLRLFFVEPSSDAQSSSLASHSPPNASSVNVDRVA